VNDVDAVDANFHAVQSDVERHENQRQLGLLSPGERIIVCLQTYRDNKDTLLAAIGTHSREGKLPRLYWATCPRDRHVVTWFPPDIC